MAGIRHGVVATLTAAGALGVTAAGASAATIAVTPEPGGTGSAYVFTGQAAEANQLTISKAGNAYRFADPGAATLTAPGCAAAGAKAFNCPPLTGTTILRVRLAAGNDAFTPSIPRSDPASLRELDGGDGNDRLDLSQFGGSFGGLEGGGTATGGGGDDLLIGGPFSSGLDGGPGNDRLVAGPAGSFTNFVSGAQPDGADTFEGGPGSESVSYSARGADVRGTADGAADDGQAGEGDNIGAQVDSIVGGRGNDTLAIGGGLNGRLQGLDGNDDLRGGEGDDELFGGPGADAVDGAGGDDALATEDSFNALAGDALHGGPGEDTVDYGRRERAAASVSVRLDGAANDGEAGEGDNVFPDVEAVHGTTANDTLVGAAGAQRLFGGDGDDALDDGGGAGDLLRGAAGNDSLRARDSLADDVGCGVGTDNAVVDFVDAVTGCESVDRGPAPDRTAPNVTVSGLKSRLKLKQVLRGLRFRVAANEPARFEIKVLATTKRARLSAFNLTLATKRFPQLAPRQSVRIKLNKRLVGRPKRATLRVEVAATDAAGNARTVRKTVRVRR